jgi:hypothetical protein
MRKFIEKVLKIAGRTLQILHLLRVQLFAALLLFLAIPIGVCLHNGTFIGLSDAIGYRSLTLLTTSLFLLAWTLHITTRLVLIYGPARYCIPNITLLLETDTPSRKFLHSPWFTLVIAAVLPIPTLIDIWRNTDCIPATTKAFWIAFGFIVAVILLVASANLHDRLEAVNGTTAEQMYPPLFIIHPGAGRTATGRFQPNTANLAIPSAPAMIGIFDRGRLRSGHLMALIFLGFFLSFYFGFFLEGLWADYDTAKLPAALFFVALLLTLITWTLAGLSFTLDRFHIPILTALLLSSLAYSAACPNDHEFLLCKKERTNTPLTPAEVVNAWQKTHPGICPTSPIIVVAAEGGGIEASAWAGLVLSKLEEATKETGHQLHDSVVLVSAVSGGSTAAYYYLDQFGSDPTGNPNFVDKNAFKNSEASSLGAAAWGLAYPDFFRTLPLLSSLVFAHSDRGYALERSWVHNHGSHDSIGAWIDQASRGLRPAVIFNATGVETGQPVLFGTTQLSSKFQWFQGLNDSQLDQQFLSTFPKTDLAVSTAARMSATFPYVSPEARPAKSLVDDYSTTRPPPSQTTFQSPFDAWNAQRLHVADGGLFDNTGVVSAVHWIYDLSQNPPDHLHPVILIMITSPYQEKSGASWSWQHQLIGPIETLLHTRTGSQHVRRNLEAQLLSDLIDKTATDSKSNQVAGSDSAAGNPEKLADAKEPDKTLPQVTVLRFCNVTDPKEQTLSWHLTESQKAALSKTWQDHYSESGDQRDEVDALKYSLDRKQPKPHPSNSCPSPPPLEVKKSWSAILHDFIARQADTQK